jgi:hypothetical protein
MNIIVSIDDQLAHHASEVAQKMGKSLSQVVLEYLQQLASSAERDQQWAEFEQSCLTSGGRLNGWKFNRDEANQR